VQLPNQIHVLPITSNQDYGFQYEPLVKPDPMFAYNHQKCDVTAYAETYCSSMNGQSPFAKPEGAAVAAAVKK
jgi:FAM183A and FAM183B related